MCVGGVRGSAGDCGRVDGYNRGTLLMVLQVEEKKEKVERTTESAGGISSISSSGERNGRC